MNTIIRPLAPLFVAVFLSACGAVQNPFGQSEPAPAAPAPQETAEAQEPSSVLQRQDGTSNATPASGLLGETVAALGDPVQPGFWLKTPLVTTEQPGIVERPGGGTVQVTLLPLGGEATGGSQISLAAIRGLDIGLTELITLKVYSG
jgi:hypothetical protein